MKHDTVVLLNKTSGSVRSRSRIEAKLQKLGHVHTVENVADFTQIYKKIYKHEPRMVVFAGGDGTFIHGVDALQRLGYEGDYGLIPLGTANYIARNLAIPMRIDSAIKRIRAGNLKTVPVAKVNGRFFLLFIAIGLSHKVAKHVSIELKKRFGQAAYVMELVKQSRHNQSFSYRVDSPQLQTPISGESHQLLVYNSDLNKQVYIAPKHSLQDPTLRLIVADTGKSIIKLYIGWLLMMMSFGRIKINLKTAELQEAKITISPQQSIDYDGEILTSSSYYVEIGKETIRVMC